MPFYFLFTHLCIKLIWHVKEITFFIYFPYSKITLFMKGIKPQIIIEVVFNYQRI